MFIYNYVTYVYAYYLFYAERSALDSRGIPARRDTNRIEAGLITQNVFGTMVKSKFKLTSIDARATSTAGIRTSSSPPIIVRYDLETAAIAAHLHTSNERCHTHLASPSSPNCSTAGNLKPHDSAGSKPIPIRKKAVGGGSNTPVDYFPGLSGRYQKERVRTPRKVGR